MATKIFYTYVWLRENGTPYYVGKGTQRRAYRRGSPPRDRIIVQEWLNESQAFEAEKFLISYYGRKDTGTGLLINLTDGGEGASGKPPLSAAARACISKAQKGNARRSGAVLSVETKQKISKSLSGKKRSPESIEKQASKRRGVPLSETHRGKIAAGNRGKVLSAETRARIGRASMGRFDRDSRGRLCKW
jgi:NUMOD3 motif-containing protein